MTRKKRQPRVEQVDIYDIPTTHEPKVEVFSGAEQFREFETLVRNGSIKVLETQTETLHRLSLPAVYPTPKENSRAKKVSGGVLLGGTSVEEILVVVTAAVVWLTAVSLVVYLTWFKGSNS